MRRGAGRFELVVFDADDTLWRSEDYFVTAEEFFREQVEPFASNGVDVLEVLRRTEIGNIPISGYGVKPYALSMVQAAVAATDGAIPSRVVAQLVDYAHDMLSHPVDLLPGVVDALAELSATHRLGLITKGDLLHQMRKIRESGLVSHFERLRVVEEKDVPTYRAVFTEWQIDPAAVVMVGNSLKSDVLPIIELGGHGVHVPYHVTWNHEMVLEHNGDHTELASISDLPAWLAAL
ncbi:MAG TPA: HAD family hydrolase [Ilumatobacter sp.]|nr:HAD family hydrolase [Ilumatobacter sp.]